MKTIVNKYPFLNPLNQNINLKPKLFKLKEEWIMSNDTQTVLDHHLGAFGSGDIEELLSDYTDDSVLITPSATFRGIDELRTAYDNFLEILPPGCDFELVKKEIVDDMAYIIWNAESDKCKVHFATDTFIIRDGKIVQQTVGMLMDMK